MKSDGPIPLRAAIIGCGNISQAYLRLSPLFRGFVITACADIEISAARSRAGQFSIAARSVADVLADPQIDLIVNLTVPDAHFSVSQAALQAGKHVYSEKPVALSLQDGRHLAKLAQENSLKLGCAPDTFLGSALQWAREQIDNNIIGEIHSGSCHIMNRGMEHWHPNPDFFFKPGGGPVLDIGPYYITALIHLLGPIDRVAALSATPRRQREIGNGPRRGEKIEVETPTSFCALLDFSGGARITFSASWDVWSHSHNHIELYGTAGTMILPDPNFFGGAVDIHLPDRRYSGPGSDWSHPFVVPNFPPDSPRLANYRACGLADMARAIATGGDFRCSMERALHGLDAMLGILHSANKGQFVRLETRCSRPEALGTQAARALMTG